MHIYDSNQKWCLTWIILSLGECICLIVLGGLRWLLHKQYLCADTSSIKWCQKDSTQEDKNMENGLNVITINQPKENVWQEKTFLKYKEAKISLKALIMKPIIENQSSDTTDKKDKKHTCQKQQWNKISLQAGESTKKIKRRQNIQEKTSKNGADNENWLIASWFM